MLRICNEARVPVTPAAGRSGVCGASVPLHGGVVLDLLRAHRRSSTSTRRRWCSTCAPGRSATCSRTTLRAEHGVTIGHWPQSIELSTVGGWLACRGAGQYSTRYGKIEDMVVGLDVVLADGRSDQHRRRAARRGRARPHAAVRRQRGHARHHHRRPAAPAPGTRDRAPRRLRVRLVRRRARRLPAHPAPRRDARGAPALRRRSRPTGTSRHRPASIRCSSSTRATRHSSTR